MPEVKDQIFTARSRAQWGHGIGMFFGRLAEIERQTHYLRLLSNATPRQEEVTTISLNQLSKTWVNLSFEDRLNKLITECTRDERLKHFEPYLYNTKSLIDVRNVLSHGSFAVKEGSTPEKPNYCVWCFPEDASSNSQDAQPAHLDVVHIEQLEEGMTNALHITLGLDRLIEAFSKEGKFDVSESHEKQLSLDQRYASSVLQLNIGQLITSMGAIELMIVGIYQNILNPKYDDRSLNPIRKLTGYWLSLTLKRKVDDLLEKLPETGEHVLMRKVLREVGELIAFRNILTHSIVRYEISDTGVQQLVAVRHVRSGLETIPKKEVITQIKKSMALSDDLSEAMARVGSQLNAERRESLGLTGCMSTSWA
ncbi:hypothetical protein [Pseudomonas frederiksbergensis]|uniref:hypothetical protein n=1 Tax=Pseudomonas frederiksbergensis TaxID=104087 RepID=UPI003D2045E2